MRAPRDRNRRVSVIEVVIALVSLPNCSPRCLADRETEKKLGSAFSLTVDLLVAVHRPRQPTREEHQPSEARYHA